MSRLRRIKLTSLNEHLICGICSGYFVEATTIIECLHTFCKTCIVRYLTTSSFCPVCDVQVHKTKPLLSLREDPTLQDVVYKLVPGLFHSEMDRRVVFYKEHPEAGGDKTEQSLKEHRHFFHVDDQISLSLEYLPPAHAHAHALGLKPLRPPQHSLLNGKVKSPTKNSSPNGKSGDKEKGSSDAGDGTNVEESDSEEDEDKILHRRYLKCPAAVKISHLEKFVRMKYGLTSQHRVDVVHNGDCLDSELTLLDVVYMYKWREDAPLKLLYTVVVSPHYRAPRKRTRVIDRALRKSPIKKEADNTSTSPNKRAKLEDKPVKDTSKHSSPEKMDVVENESLSHGSACSNLDSSRDDGDDAMVIDESVSAENDKLNSCDDNKSPTKQLNGNSLTNGVSEKTNSDENQSEQSESKIVYQDTKSVSTDNSDAADDNDALTTKSSLVTPISTSNTVSHDANHFNSVPLFSMPSLPITTHESPMSSNIKSMQTSNTSSDNTTNIASLCNQKTNPSQTPLSLSTLTFPTYSTITMNTSITSNESSASPPPLSTVTSLPPYIPPPSTTIYPTSVKSSTSSNAMPCEGTKSNNSNLPQVSVTPLSTQPANIQTTMLPVTAPIKLQTSTHNIQHAPMQATNTSKTVPHVIVAGQAAIKSLPPITAANLPLPIVPTKPRLGRPPNSSKILASRVRGPLAVMGMRGNRPLGTQGISGFRTPGNPNIRPNRAAIINMNQNVGLLQRAGLPKQSQVQQPKPLLMPNLNTQQSPMSVSSTHIQAKLSSNVSISQQPNVMHAPANTLNTDKTSMKSPISSARTMPLSSSLGMNISEDSLINVASTSKTNTTTIQALKNKVSKNIHSSNGTLGYTNTTTQQTASTHKTLNCTPNVTASISVSTSITNNTLRQNTVAYCPSPSRSALPSSSPKASVSSATVSARLPVQQIPARTSTPLGVPKATSKSPGRPKATGNASSILSIAQNLTNKQLQQRNVQTTMPSTIPSVSDTSTSTVNSLPGNIPCVGAPNQNLMSPLAGLSLPGAANALTTYMAYMQTVQTAAYIQEMNKAISQQKNGQRSIPSSAPNSAPMDLSPTNKNSPSSPLTNGKAGKINTSAATPKSAGSPLNKTPAAVPSPKPAQSPAPASPSTPNISPPTPEVTITKLPNSSSTSVPSTSSSSSGSGVTIGRSSTVSINKSNNSSTNTVSITKRPSINSNPTTTGNSINKYAVTRSPSNASVRQIPNPSLLSHQSESRNGNSNIKSVKKSPIKSHSLKTNNNNNNNTNKNAVSSISKTKSTTQVTVTNSKSLNNGHVNKSSENSPLKETGPLPDTSSISRIEHLTKSLPAANNSALVSSGFRFFDGR